MLKFLLILSITLSLYAKDSKMLLLYVEKDGCQWCKKMDNEVIDNSDIMKKIEKQYDFKRVKKGSNLIPSFLDVKYYPTSYILSSEGSKIIDEIIGYQKADKFLDYLQFLYNLENEED